MELFYPHRLFPTQPKLMAYHRNTGTQRNKNINETKETNEMPSFATMRKNLDELEKEALIRVIGDLYERSIENRAFLNAKFNLKKTVGGSGFEHYKKIVTRALFSDWEDEISFREARKAISDYRKATKDVPGVAELLVIGAECGIKFTLKYGDIDEPFYTSLENLFRDAVKAVRGLKPALMEPLRERLFNAQKSVKGKLGWGFPETIADYYDDAWES